MDTRQHNYGTMEFHRGPTNWSLWGLIGWGRRKIDSSHRTQDCIVTQRSSMVLMGAYWMGEKKDNSSHGTQDYKVTQRSSMVLMGPYRVGEKKDRLKP